MRPVLEERNTICDVVQNENIIYIILDKSGILLSYDVCRELWDIQGFLPIQYTSQWNSYIRSLQVDEKYLYIFLHDVSKILIYDLYARTYEEIDVFYSQGNAIAKKEIASVVKYENTYILIPFQGDEIAIFDRTSRLFSFCSEWKKEFLKELKHRGLEFNLIRRKSFCVNGKWLYLLADCGKKDIIFSLQLESMKFGEIYDIDIPGMLWGMEQIGSEVWIQNRIDDGKQLICWSLEEKKIIKKTNILVSDNSIKLKWKDAGTKLTVSCSSGFGKCKILIVDKLSLDIVDCVDKVYIHEFITWKETKNVVVEFESTKKECIEEKDVKIVTVPEMILFRGLTEQVTDNKEQDKIIKTKSVGKIIFEKTAE